jgi:ketosteroid isomerase-like protein
MSRLPLSILAFAYAFFATALFAQIPARQFTDEVLPSVTLPPELDRVLREYEHAWGIGDGAALAALFADDGFVLQNNAPPVRGRAAIQAAYQGQGGAPLRLRALAYASGTTDGYIIGSYRYGAQSGDVGKFTLTLRRKPGERWMIFSDMDNSNVRRSNMATPPARTPRPAG